MLLFLTKRYHVILSPLHLWVTKSPSGAEVVDGWQSRGRLHRDDFPRFRIPAEPVGRVSRPAKPHHGEPRTAAPTAGAEPQGKDPSPSQLRPTFLGNPVRNLVAVAEGAGDRLSAVG